MSKEHDIFSPKLPPMVAEQRKFHFTPRARFSCNSCGKCCSSNFEIPLQNSKVALIKGSSTYQSLIKNGYQPLRLLGETFHFLDSDKTGKCHFSSNNLCGLHKFEGLSHKPLICQIYPYNLVLSPDGIHVSLLYSCPSVVKGDGVFIEESRESLHALFESHQGRVPLLGPVQEHILVTQHSTVTWSQYLGLELELLTHLTEDDPISYLFNSALQLLTPKPQFAHFDETAGTLDSWLSGPFKIFVSSIGAHLQQIEDDESIPLLRPQTQLVKNAITQFIHNQIHGKLLIIGPTLVTRLIVTACGIALLLHQLWEQEEPSLEQLQQSFAFVEERLVSQTNELDSDLLEFENYLQDQS